MNSISKKSSGFGDENYLNISMDILNLIGEKSPSFFFIFITQIAYFSKSKATSQIHERKSGSGDCTLIYCLEGKGSKHIIIKQIYSF